MRRFVCLMFVLCGFWGTQNSWAAGDDSLSCDEFCMECEGCLDVLYAKCTTEGVPTSCYLKELPNKSCSDMESSEWEKYDVECGVIESQCTVRVSYWCSRYNAAIKIQTKTAKDASVRLDPPDFGELAGTGCEIPKEEGILAGWCDDASGCEEAKYGKGSEVGCSGNYDNEIDLYPYFRKCDNGYKMAEDRMSCEPLVYSLKLDSQWATDPGTTQVFYKYQQSDQCYYYTEYDCTTCIAGNKITIPTRSGYTFGGYWTQAGGTGDMYIDANGTFSKDAYRDFAPTDTDSTTLYAHWVGNPYTVTLDLATDGLTNEPIIESKGTTKFHYYFNTTTDGCVYYSERSGGGLSNCLQFEVPVRQGYTFGGYYTAENGAGIQYIDAEGNISDNLYTKISNDTTLYAQWTANVYKVIYSCGCDGVTGCSGTPPESVEVTYDTYFTVASEAPNCKFDGSNFEGWKVSETDDVLVAGKEYLWTYPENKTISVKWKMCPQGYYCPSKDKQNKCPIGATSNEGAKTVKECYLKGGGTRVCSGGACYTLPDNMENVFFTVLP